MKWRARKVIAVATPEPLKEYHGCDRCGISANGGIVSIARFRVNTSNGPVYLCGHHFLFHRLHIHERAYETSEL